MRIKRFLQYFRELLEKYNYPYFWLDLRKKPDYTKQKFPLSGVAITSEAKGSSPVYYKRRE